MQTTHLSNNYLHTLERVFEHPTSHTLEWRHVIALITHLGTVEEEGNRHLKFTVKGVSQTFKRSEEKEVGEVQQILDLRRFLESVGVGRHGVLATKSEDTDAKLQFLVVINREETLIFRSEEKDSVPEHLHPYDPHGVLHHVKNTGGADRESRLPESLTYYQAIAETLAGAGEILLMGNGTGASSAMDHLKDFLATHDPEIGGKVVGTLTLDIEALTEGQLLQEARAFFISRKSGSGKN